jgi:hypothetical protein
LKAAMVLNGPVSWEEEEVEGWIKMNFSMFLKYYKY